MPRIRQLLRIVGLWARRVLFGIPGIFLLISAGFAVMFGNDKAHNRLMWWIDWMWHLLPRDEFDAETIARLKTLDRMDGLL